MQMLSGYYQDYRKVIAWNHASRILKNPSMGFSEKKFFPLALFSARLLCGVLLGLLLGL